MKHFAQTNTLPDMKTGLNITFKILLQFVLQFFLFEPYCKRRIFDSFKTLVNPSFQIGLLTIPVAAFAKVF